MDILSDVNVVGSLNIGGNKEGVSIDDSGINFRGIDSKSLNFNKRPFLTTCLSGTSVQFPESTYFNKLVVICGSFISKPLEYSGGQINFLVLPTTTAKILGCNQSAISEFYMLPETFSITVPPQCTKFELKKYYIFGKFCEDNDDDLSYPLVTAFSGRKKVEMDIELGKVNECYCASNGNYNEFEEVVYGIVSPCSNEMSLKVSMMMAGSFFH